MLMEITVPLGVLGITDDQHLPEGTSLEFERIASVSGCGSPSLVVSGADVTAVVRSIQGRSTVEDVEVVSENGDKTVVRLRWDGAVPDILERVRENDGTVLSGVAQNGVWTFELRFTNQASGSRFYTQYDDPDNPLTVRRVNPQRNGHRIPLDRLTPEQRDALSRAAKRGYFEVPRRTTLQELAGQLDISDTAVSQRLRRGIMNLLEDPAYASLESVEPARHEPARNDD